MVERICSRCDGASPGEHAFCGHCGAPFDQPLARRSVDQPLARRSAAALAARARQLPAPWKQAGKVAALGAATIVAEAGLAWLQRRQQGSRPALPARQMPTSARIVALGWRVSETWQGDQLRERVEEQVMWLEPLPRRQ
jgi:hypothetical protein